LPSASLPARVGGRAFVGASVTPEYLTGLFKGHTSIQAQKLIEPFIGNWMAISGSLKEVMSSSPDYAQVTFWGRGVFDNLSTVYTYFRSKESIARLSILRPKDSITVVGQLKEISNIAVNLDNCELND
jgi:hypothetical protein